MGQLYTMANKINSLITERKLNMHEIKGRITLKTGFILNFINQDTPDDPIKIKNLAAAVKEILDVSL